MQNPKDLTPEQALEAYQEMYENCRSAEASVILLEEANLRMEKFNNDLKKKLECLTIELEREKRSVEHWYKAYLEYRDTVAKHLAKYDAISPEATPH